jgi:hypothetical protein
MHYINEHSTLLGTATGTVLTIIVNISSQDVLKTAVLAMVGAVVSFCVSYTLKWLVKKLKK